MKKDVFKKIKSLRRKLDRSIEKNGLNSSETRELSNKMDKLITEYYESIKVVEYPKNSKMLTYYKKSYEALKNVTEQLERFPLSQEWNKFAKENGFFCSISIEYISNLNWNYLEIQVKRELNMKV